MSLAVHTLFLVVTKMQEKYKNFNITIILLTLLFILIPFLTFITKSLIPNSYDLLRCPYYKLTGNPCPFCGITTDFKNFLLGKLFVHKYNIMSTPLFFYGIFELFFRMVLIKHSDKINYKLIYKDILIHSIVLLVLILYIILFFLFNLARFHS